MSQFKADQSQSINQLMLKFNQMVLNNFSSCFFVIIIFIKADK